MLRQYRPDANRFRHARHERAEVARRVETTRPALPILFVTGYANGAALEGVSEGQIIGKPFVEAELHKKGRTALARRAAGKVVRLRRS